jgi:hypothetical protein
MLEKAVMSQLARLNRRPQKEGENVARRRFQNGSVKRRGDVWIGRYLEDVEENGVIRRKHRTVTLSHIRGSDGKTVTEEVATQESNTLFRLFRKMGSSDFESEKTLNSTHYPRAFKKLPITSSWEYGSSTDPD